MDLNTFKSGKTWLEYMNSISKNREKFESRYNEFDLTDDDVAPFRGAENLRVVAIGEDWCPDVYNTLGIVARVCERLAGCELRIFERDSRPEVMENYLTDGKKSIPVVAIYDESFREICRWAGRNREAQEWVTSFRAGRNYDDIPKDELQLFKQEFQRRYEDKYARMNFEEIRERFSESLSRR